MPSSGPAGLPMGCSRGCWLQCTSRPCIRAHSHPTFFGFLDKRTEKHCVSLPTKCACFFSTVSHTILCRAYHSRSSCTELWAAAESLRLGWRTCSPLIAKYVHLDTPRNCTIAETTTPEPSWQNLSQTLRFRCVPTPAACYRASSTLTCVVFVMYATAIAA